MLKQKENKNVRKSSASIDRLKNRFKFNFQEIELIKKRFDKFSKNGFLNRKSFRDSLGILGLDHAPFLSDRIFEIIDTDKNGEVKTEKMTIFVYY